MNAELQNVTANANFNVTIDLQKLANLCFKFCQYNTNVFSGLILKFNAPKSTMVIHKTGKVILLGKLNKRKIKYAFNKQRKLLQIIGVETSEPIIKISNLVYSGKFDCRICPFKMKSILKDYLHYEPELFPFMRYYVPNSTSCVTMFHNGKWYISGTTNEGKVQSIITDLYTKINNSNTHEIISQ